MLQDRELLLPKEKSRKSRAWGLLQWILTFLVFGYIYSIFQQQEIYLNDIFFTLIAQFTPGKAFHVVFLFLLVPLNWALESAKWKFLAQKVIPISFGEAFRSTLTGLAVGVALPGQIGDTIGRITSLHSEARLKTLGAAVISNGIQFYVSILGGTFCWFFVATSLSFSRVLSLSISILLGLLVLGIPLLGGFRQQLFHWQSRYSWLSTLQGYLQVAGDYSGSELLIALGIGMVRYLVFVSQFVLALTLFQFSISLAELASCVGLIFLAKTLIPAINSLGDLGVREFLALFIFAPYAMAANEVAAATFLIWLINILAPLVVGLFFIWKNKWSVRYA